MSRRASSRSVGRIRELVRSWERYLRAGNRSPRTIQSYAEAALQFDAWLNDQDLPVDAGLIERRHVEAWLASLLDRWKPATAAARYRSLRQFFRWLEDDGELDVSPMTKMRPPQVPEQPVPVLTDDQLGALLDACAGKAFVARRDTAIIRTLLDTGGRLSEVARLKLDDVDFNLDVLYVMGKGRRGRSVPFGPLVLLHGWPLDSRQWRRQLEGLSDEFRVVAWDAPGAGRSSDPPETFRLADWADCLAEFIEVLNLAPAHVAGLSFGGGLALELFQRHPDVVRSLILLSAYAGWGGSLSAEEVHERLELTRRNTTLPPEQWAPALIDTLLPDDANPELADELAAMLVDFHPQATRTSLEAFAEADLRDVLAEVDVPTLLLYGELDVRSPRTVWEAIHQGIAGSRLVVIPDVGHMVDMQAAERCNDEIRAFLRHIEASTPLGREP